MTNQRTGRRSLFVAALVVLCLALAGIDAALVLRNRELSARLGELSRLVRAAERSPIPALEGRPFPVQTLFDREGQPIGLADIPASHATLLFVSSPSCDYCQLAEPVWERTAHSAAGSHLRVLGLVLERSPSELDAEHVPFPLLAAGESATSLVRQIPGVPAAVFIDSAGVVKRAIYGGEQIGLEEAVDRFLAGADSAFSSEDP